jgi:hypothetical protein
VKQVIICTPDKNLSQSVVGTRVVQLDRRRDILHLEDIPKEWRAWHPSIRRAGLLSESLFNAWNDALLFRTLATLRLDVPVFDSIQELRWTGSRPQL